MFIATMAYYIEAHCIYELAVKGSCPAWLPDVWGRGGGRDPSRTTKPEELQRAHTGENFDKDR